MPSLPRTPSTQFALLGLLSLGPGTGYDLKQRAASSVGHFWAESYGQIYPTLKRLQSDGLVTCEVVPSQRAGKPDRLVYTITGLGSETLRRWLAVPPRPEPLRSELLLKLFFGDETLRESLMAHVARMQDDERAHLRQYGSIVEELKRRFACAPGLPFWLMTLSYGKHRSQAIVDWADETLGQLTAVRVTEPPSAPTSQPRSRGHISHTSVGRGRR